jgi:transcription-repair coupling factor (superfamily II helicase)
VDERVRIYRRLAGSPSIEAIDAVYREMVERFGAAPEPAKHLVDVARIRALAAEAGATAVAVARKRLSIAPLSVSDERKGELCARGAVWIEREKKVVIPLAYGESVTQASLGLLDAILA